ncbi:glycosyltransferase family 4 protein [Ideonella sp.]|uniref:glycosyltransferase family 4 protein n=1 Tax=Ideonella sp. TaxID=1929293 RepID=UPI002B495B08|nr:glycosyltransferase family 4 protein [Ideonella sp.]HJV70750.1 glycosyltransferase family 4 protein [Ideonella sp.]
MRIAQVAPLFESVPPRLYGGTERVVSYLTEALVAQGHEVTLFATADSVTRARLVAGSPHGLRLDGRSLDHEEPHRALLDKVYRRRGAFDVIHFHTDCMHFPMLRGLGVPHLTTLHGRLDLPEAVATLREFPDVPLVSISDAQRTPAPWACWLATVHHGLPHEAFRFHPGPGRYLAFLGRIAPEKGCDRAIEIAARLGRTLRIAAKVDPMDEAYFNAEIRPLLAHPLVEFIGEIGEREKSDFLGQATALLFPIDWPEPFGLVMIEAIACGTPVVAFRRGSVPEIIEPGLTGCIVDDLDQAVHAIEDAVGLDRRRCRRRFEQRFTAERMARDYLSVYERLVRRTAGPCPMEASNG